MPRPVWRVEYGLSERGDGREGRRWQQPPTYSSAGISPRGPQRGVTKPPGPVHACRMGIPRLTAVGVAATAGSPVVSTASRTAGSTSPGAQPVHADRDNGAGRVATWNASSSGWARPGLEALGGVTEPGRQADPRPATRPGPRPRPHQGSSPRQPDPDRRMPAVPAEGVAARR